jgi:hypothetical protein
VASVANPAVTGTAAPEATAVFPGAIGPKVNHRLELISGVRRVPVLSHTTGHCIVTFGSDSWQAIFLADTILACQPARNPEGAEPIAVTCRIPHAHPVMVWSWRRS